MNREPRMRVHWVKKRVYPIAKYKEATGQGMRANPETAGRFHSNWLSMMYSRLKIAKTLLRDDGVIFISIDDKEIHNLRRLCDDVFGEENFVASIIWQKVYSPKNSAKHFSEDHDYIVVYAKKAETWRPTLLPKTDGMLARYNNPDNDPRGPWKTSDLSARNYYGAGTYSITTPSGRIIEGPQQDNNSNGYIQPPHPSRRRYHPLSHR